MAGDTSPVIRLLVWIFKKALKTGWIFLEGTSPRAHLPACES
jgi:hypothetical protein